MNFLVIGGGSIGKRHIKNLNHLGFTSVFCLRRNRDSSFEKETNAKVVISVDEITVPIDGVIVCSPTSLHNQGVVLAIKLGAAVFMEKPLIHSKEGLQESRRIMKKLNRPFFIGFMLRYHPMVLKIKEVLESGTIGAIYSARFEFGSFLPYWHPWEDYRIGYAARKELGGGVINTITHELDLIQFFFGKPKSVCCISRNFGKLNIDVEEIADSIFEYSDKLVTLHLDYMQKDYNRTVRILGENGAISWNWHDQKVIITRHKEETIEETLASGFNVNQLYMDELGEFVRIIREGDLSHSLNANHAIENAGLMLAMHASANTRQVVSIV